MCIEMPVERGWIGPNFEWGRVSGKHPGQDKSVN